MHRFDKCRKRLMVRLCNYFRLPFRLSLRSIYCELNVRLNGCLTKSHPRRLSRKSINCSILHQFALLIPTLSHWQGVFQNFHTVQKMKFSIKDFFSKCDQIRRLLRIWWNLLKKPLVEIFIFSVVSCITRINIIL